MPSVLGIAARRLSTGFFSRSGRLAVSRSRSMGGGLPKLPPDCWAAQRNPVLASLLAGGLHGDRARADLVLQEVREGLRVAAEDLPALRSARGPGDRAQRREVLLLRGR